MGIILQRRRVRLREMLARLPVERVLVERQVRVGVRARRLGLWYRRLARLDWELLL